MVYTTSGAFGTRADELIKQMPISRIRQIMNLSADKPVRVYSYQTRAALAAAQDLGYWTGDAGRVWDGNGEDVRHAYAWMQQQMAALIPGYSGDLPIWGWLKRPSTKTKPSAYRGTAGEVRVTALVPRSRIVFSDYTAWHRVLWREKLSLTEDEHERHCHDWPDHWSYVSPDRLAEYDDAIIPSWQRCLAFEPTLNKDTIDWGASSPKYFRIQACVDRICPEDITAIRMFTATDNGGYSGEA